MNKKLRVALPVAALAATAFSVLPLAGANGAESCVPVREGVIYDYTWNDTTVSLTLTPNPDRPGVRCEDATASLAGWDFLNPPAQWPQKNLYSKTITLKADATEPVSTSGAATCQNDGYWGKGPEVGSINTAGGVPFKEIFVNHQLDKGTGANWAADPMTGGLTASLGPCNKQGPGGGEETPGGGEVSGPSEPLPPMVHRPSKLPHTGR